MCPYQKIDVPAQLNEVPAGTLGRDTSLGDQRGVRRGRCPAARFALVLQGVVIAGFRAIKRVSHVRVAPSSRVGSLVAGATRGRPLTVVHSRQATEARTGPKRPARGSSASPKRGRRSSARATPHRGTRKPPSWAWAATASRRPRSRSGGTGRP